MKKIFFITFIAISASLTQGCIADNLNDYYTGLFIANYGAEQLVTNV